MPDRGVNATAERILITDQASWEVIWLRGLGEFRGLGFRALGFGGSGPESFSQKVIICGLATSALLFCCVILSC